MNSPISIEPFNYQATPWGRSGAEVLWPCEPYKTADAALPEGWPL